MWTESRVYSQDLEQVACCESIDWRKFDNTTVLITGATGLIGYTMVSAILYSTAKHSVNVRIIALVRNMEKARHKFAQILQQFDNLEFVTGDVSEYPVIDSNIDYIIHGASVTASASFVDQPVETIKTSLYGTISMLELAKQNNVISMIYMSSMEVYGSPTLKRLLTEADVDYLDPLLVRSCYPESKRMAENLCISYAAEYGINVKVARLAQTFGPGIDKDDNRVFAQFARKAQLGEDIVLLTDGSSERMYIYTMDAVSALITILLEGTRGNAYNIANKNTYCSIRQMAEMVAECLQKQHKSAVLVQKVEDQTIAKFSPTHHIFLDTSKLEGLGWKPSVDLPEMYKRMSDTI